MLICKFEKMFPSSFWHAKKRRGISLEIVNSLTLSLGGVVGYVNEKFFIVLDHLAVISHSKDATL